MARNLTVYISSTFLDLKEHREAAYKALRVLRFDVLAMEDYVASDDRPVDRCLRDVESCDAYVGIVGWRYGSIPSEANATHKSITELEYLTARERRIPCFIFLLAESAPCPPSHIDAFTSEGDRGSLVKRFREELAAAKIVSHFRTADELARQVTAALAAWRGRPHSASPVPSSYLPWLKSEVGSIELLGVRLRQGQSIRIGSVYVPLMATDRDAALELRESSLLEATGNALRNVLPSTVTATLGMGRERAPDRLMHSVGATSLLELLDDQSIFISGPPGSGKSTFCRWVAWLLADGTVPEQYGDANVQEQFPERLRHKLPILIKLRDFEELLPEHRHCTLNQFERFLEAWMTDRKPGGLEWAAAQPWIYKGDALVMFDGADEVTPARRQALIAGLAACIPAWLALGTRILLTARPHGLSSADARRFGLRHAPVGALSPQTQRLLVSRWFAILTEDQLEGDRIAARLFDDLGTREWLSPLASNPLLLTALCIVYGQGRRLPQDKHELYDQLVDSVLHSRFEAQMVPLVRNRLAVVANGMHVGPPGDTSRPAPEAQVTFKQIDQMLEEYKRVAAYTETGFQHVVESREELLTSSGLLLTLDEKRAAFYHLSFQDFLAAERIGDVERDRLADVFDVRADSGHWRNTLSFLYSAQLANNVTPARAVELLTDFVLALRAGSPSVQRVMLASDCVEILRSRGIVIGPEPLLVLQQICLEGIEGRASRSERASLGEALAAIGDPRFRADAWYLPDDDWLGFVSVTDARHLPETPAAQRRPGVPSTLPPFYVQRYPVTVAQFRAFSEDRRGGQGRHVSETPNGLGTLPVVSVSWSEAMEYCHWLTRVIQASPQAADSVGQLVCDGGWIVRMPTEEEWEALAIGIVPDSSDALQRTVVGCVSRNPLGVEDLVGNVFEWTASAPRHRPYDPYDARLSEARVVRGGTPTLRELRATGFQASDLGFRAVLSLR